MTWERALEADARLAAKNAVLIRAALRQSFDPERAFIGYRNTMPDENLTLPQQRVRSRSWAIMNIRPNLEPLREVLLRIWAEAYALGDTAAREAIEEARRAQKADTTTGVDWSKWKPGDAVAAILLKPPRAFQRLLEGAGITLKGFSDTTLTDIGNAIGEAIELGTDAKTSAKNIMNHVANPARALSIAITEQNRAISNATMARYREAGLEKMEWLVFQPCDICAKNAGQIVAIGAPFPSGDTQPPAHPHCRCALAPVIPDFDDPASTAGSITSPTITETTISTIPVSVEQIAIDRAKTGKKINIDDFLKAPRSYEADNAEMGKVIYAQGWNEPSLVVTAEEYEKLKATGKFVELHRGGPAGLTEGLTSGKPWIGDGNAGPGTYMTTDRSRAEAFAGLAKSSTGGSEVVTALIPKELIDNAPNLGTSPENPLPSKWSGKKRADYVVNAAEGKGAYEASYESSAPGDYVIYNTSSLVIKGQ